MKGGMMKVEQWTVDLTDTNSHCGWSINNGDFNIATVYAGKIQSPRPEGGHVNLPENQESIKRAHLIASAPDLLEAAKDMVNAHYAEGFDLPWGTLKAAIANAEGGRK